MFCKQSGYHMSHIVMTGVCCHACVITQVVLCVYTVLLSQSYRRSPGAEPDPACAGANSRSATPASFMARAPSALYSQLGFMTLKFMAALPLYTYTGLPEQTPNR